MKKILSLLLLSTFLLTGCEDKKPSASFKQLVSNILDGTTTSIPNYIEIRSYGFDEMDAITANRVLEGASYQRDINLALSDPELATYAKVLIDTDEQGNPLWMEETSVAKDTYIFPSIPLNISKGARELKEIWGEIIKNPNDKTIVIKYKNNSIEIEKSTSTTVGGKKISKVETKSTFQAKNLKLLPEANKP